MEAFLHVIRDSDSSGAACSFMNEAYNAGSVKGTRDSQLVFWSMILSCELGFNYLIALLVIFNVNSFVRLHEVREIVLLGSI